MPSSNIIKKTLKIDGMTCVSCENRIERKLQNTPGILNAKVSYSGGTAAIAFDSQAVTLEGITEIIERMDYKVKSAGNTLGSKTVITKILGVSIVLFALYMIICRMGGLNIFNSFPQAEKNMGLFSGIAIPSARGDAKSGNIAVVNDGLQLITTGLPSGRYEPITVQKGIPVKWTIKAEDGDINGCNNRIIIPKYNKELKLKIGDNVIEFTPSESGVVPYSCWMGMIRSQITVVDDINDISATAPAAAAAEAAYTIPTDKIALARIEDGVQYVEITFDQNGFSPAVVVMQSGIETEWVINAVKPSGSNNVLLFPQYYAQIDVLEGENEITFVPEGDFDFSTADASYFGYVKAVDDLETVDLDAIRQEVDKYTPVFWDASQDSASPPSCH